MDPKIESEFAEICLNALSLPPPPKPSNNQKNRYSNITPCTGLQKTFIGINILIVDEEYRVRLRNQTDDYINASLWKLDSCVTKYIATQAPLESTVDDFWNMAKQENCHIIVSLISNDKKHCRYWENQRVTIISVECYTDFEKKNILLDGIYQIWLFQYTGWPDHSVPSSTANLAKLVTEVELVRDQETISGIIFHCSAGMGRTGTFASILLHREAKMSINELVLELRKRRHRSLVVESSEQYNVIYDTLKHLEPLH